MYSQITHGIEVHVTPIYLEDESRPDDNHFFWAYRITIANNSQSAVKLLTRYWRIVDGTGHIEEVHGEGVVGEQPLIKIGSSYQYTSGCPLATPHGIMSGHYTMRDSQNTLLRVEVPPFSLDIPGHDKRLMN